MIGDGATESPHVGTFAGRGGAGASTLTLAVDVAEPDAFSAVNVYVSVDLGVTETEVPLTIPTSLSILRRVAPFTDQASMVCCPGWIVRGLARKETISGFASAGGGTVTTTLAVQDAAFAAPVNVAL
jgi:hypothetical protein